MSAPRCVVFGTGRVAGGFLAPLLRSAGWETILVGRNRMVIEAINAKGGLWLNVAGEPSDWIGGVRAVSLDDPRLPGIVAEADLVATAVGPSSLHEVGRVLAPMLQARLQSCVDPVNIVAFENHRRAPEILTRGLLQEYAPLAEHPDAGSGSAVPRCGGPFPTVRSRPQASATTRTAWMSVTWTRLRSFQALRSMDLSPDWRWSGLSRTG